MCDDLVWCNNFFFICMDVPGFMILNKNGLKILKIYL